MKQLIFIDNELERGAREDYEFAQDAIEYHTNVPVNVVNEMKFTHSFYFLTDAQKGELLFNPAHVIVTYSMYSEASYNSYSQLYGFLKEAGLRGLTGITYVDTSFKLYKGFTNILYDAKSKDRQHITAATQHNNLITINKDGAQRIMLVKSKGKYVILLTPVNLLELLND